MKYVCFFLKCLYYLSIPKLKEKKKKKSQTGVNVSKDKKRAQYSSNVCRIYFKMAKSNDKRVILILSMRTFTAASACF